MPTETSAKLRLLVLNLSAVMLRSVVTAAVVGGGTAGSIFFLGSSRRRFRLWWRTLGVFVCVRWASFVPSTRRLCLGILAVVMVEPTRLAPRCSLSIACYFLQPRLRRSARNSGHGDGHARDAGAPCIVLRLCVCAQECVNCAGVSRNASVVTTVLRSLDPSSLFCTLVNDRSTVRYFQLRTCRECWSA